MFRKKVATDKKERKDLIKWRGHEVTRIEAFSDAVFGFAITLLIVSLEVPETFEEMMEGMKSFLPFAICFFMIFQVWLVQNTFFRRYGLHDSWTLVLNGGLLFTVLFFVYPLKFLWSALLGGHAHITSAHELTELFYIYGGGFSVIYFLFTGMYYNALRQKAELGLTDSEAFETKTNIYRNLLMGCIGLLSMLIAGIASPAYLGWAGMIYALIGPAIGLTHSRRGKIHRKKFPVVVNVVPDDHVADDEPAAIEANRN